MRKEGVNYWVDIRAEYLDYLREFDIRIPLSDYGSDRYKPFFGVLFEKDGMCYVTQVSHAQPRHARLKQQKDFYKIFDPSDNSRLIAVVNLNYMFPVPRDIVKALRFKDIDHYRTFKNPVEKSKYIDLLNMELAQINRLKLDIVAKEIYEEKYRYPDRKLAERCLDYRMLETHAKAFRGADRSESIW